MSWIKIKRDNVELVVSTESYRDLFSHQGYIVVADNSSPTQPQPIKTEKSDNEMPKEENKDVVQPKRYGEANKNKHKE